MKLVWGMGTLLLLVGCWSVSSPSTPAPQVCDPNPSARTSDAHVSLTQRVSRVMHEISQNISEQLQQKDWLRARQIALTGLLQGDTNLTAHLSEPILNELITRVDPLCWNQLESNITQRVSLCTNDLQCAELIAQLANYPPVPMGLDETTSTRVPRAFHESLATLNENLSYFCQLEIRALKGRIATQRLMRLFSSVSQALQTNDFTRARRLIQDMPLLGDAQEDARLSAQRIGLLNQLVNPRQYTARLEEMRTKAQACTTDEDADAFLTWAQNYPFVHDTNLAIDRVLNDVSGLLVGQEETVRKAYLENLALRIRSLQEKRPGAWQLPQEEASKELKDVLDRLEDGLKRHYYSPQDVHAFRTLVQKELTNLLKQNASPLTTWDMNARLRATLIEHLTHLKQAKALRQAQKYVQWLSETDHAISFDEQISRAQNLLDEKRTEGAVENRSSLCAILGEYARIMRRLKQGHALTLNEARTMHLGGILLDDDDVCARALSLGADVNGTSPADPLQRTPLLMSLQLGRTKMLAHLMALPELSMACDAHGNTPLHYIVQRPSEKFLSVFLPLCDVNATNRAGRTSLMLAAEKNQLSFVQSLLKAGAKLELVDQQGATALDAACRTGALDVARELVQSGAVPKPNHLSLAVKGNHLALVQWLVSENGLSVQSEALVQEAPAHSAVETYLIRQGAPEVIRPEEKDTNTLTRTATKISEAAGTINFKVIDGP